MKITDRETEFFEERIMEVSGDGTTWYPRVVFGKKNGKYIAWINAETIEDAELFMNRMLIAKDKSCKAVITYSDDEGVFFRSIARDYKYLFERFTFLDGSPCGKEVEG